MAEDLPPLPPDAPWWAHWIVQGLLPWFGRQADDLAVQIKRYGPALIAALCEAYVENADTIDAWIKTNLSEHAGAHLLAGVAVVRVVWQATYKPKE